MMENLTQKQMLKIMLDQFGEYHKDWKDFKKKQDKINTLVIRHDEKIKGMWKIPVISGAIITFIGGIAAVIGVFF